MDSRLGSPGRATDHCRGKISSYGLYAHKNHIQFTKFQTRTQEGWKGFKRKYYIAIKLQPLLETDY